MAKRKKYRKRRKNSDIDLKAIGTIIFSVLLAVLLYTNSGTLGEKLNEVFGGMMGILRYVLPIGTFAIAIKMACNEEDEEYITHKLIQYAILLICIAIVMSIYQISKGTLEISGNMSQVLKRAYTLGSSDIGGGAIGTLAAVPLVKLLGNLGAVVLSIGVSIMLFAFVFGIDISEFISRKVDEILTKHEENREERELKRQEKIKENEERRAEILEKRKQLKEKEKISKNETISSIQDNQKLAPEQIKINLNGRTIEPDERSKTRGRTIKEKEKRRK